MKTLYDVKLLGIVSFNKGSRHCSLALPERAEPQAGLQTHEQQTFVKGLDAGNPTRILVKE